MPSIAANTVRLSVVQGTTYKEPWRFPFAVTSLTFKGQVRDPLKNNAVVADFEFELDEDDAQRVFVKIPHTVTADITPNDRYEFDIQYETNGERYAVASGKFEVENGTTQWE